MLVLIKFGIRGNLRFLSHAETVKVFQRACVRAGIKIQHSGGFNPRPKLSLPLPRSVGVETDDDLLCLSIESSEPPIGTETLMVSLAERLPQGCELLSVSVAKTKVALQPHLATYILAVPPECVDDRLRATIKRLLASKNLDVQRRIDKKISTFDFRLSTFKNVDVRGFLRSIELDNNGNIVVECKISSSGSIRPDEILKLLGLSTDKLAAPIRRTNIQWAKTGR
jgi:radical SAM-linked protein